MSTVSRAWCRRVRLVFALAGSLMACVQKDECADDSTASKQNGKCTCTDGATVDDAVCSNGSSGQDAPKSGSFPCPSTPLTGSIAEDTTWESGVCVLGSDIAVAPGAKLTIRPGVIVKGGNGRDYAVFTLKVEGTLDVAGTADDPVIFTATTDDGHGGDTNGDEGATQPSAGHAGGIEFLQGSSGSVQHAEILYARKGIRTEGAAPKISDVVVRHCSGAAVSAGPEDAVQVAALTASDTTVNGLERRTGTITRDTVWDQADVVHMLTGDVTVASGATLNLGPGLIIKAGAYHDYTQFRLKVRGALVGQGTAVAPIVMTRSTDDLGGDTNGDEGASNGKGYHNGIGFEPGSEGELTHLQVRHASNAITVDGAIVSGTQLRLEDSSVGVSVRGGATEVSIRDSVILGNKMGIEAAPGSSVDGTGNWWGDPTGPGVLVSGDVAYEPFLAAAP